MAVDVSTLGWSTILQAGSFRPASGVAYTVTGANGSLSGSTNANGQITGSLPDGTYTLTVGGVIETVDVVSGSVGSSTVFVSVKKATYGAVGDGTTNDTVAIQAAIDAVAVAGGGTVYFPSGTYRCNVVTKPRVRLVGDAARSTILKAVAGSNADVVKGVNFATLTGKTKATGDYALGAYECEVSNLTIDGDKATQTAGYGLRIWGRAAKLTGVVIIRNCKNDGMWTEFTDVDSFADPVQVLEMSIDTLSIVSCDGNGWTHRGPHDTVCKEAVIWSCTGWAVRVESNLFDGTTYNGGVSFRHLNFFLCGNGAYNDGAQFEMHGGAITGATGTGLESTARTGSMKIRGVIIAGHATGVLLRGAQHTVHAEVSRCTTDGINLTSALGCHLDIYGVGNNNVINVTSETGPNIVRGIFDVPSTKTLKTGAAFNSAGSYMLSAYGAGGASYIQQFPSPGLSAAGWTPTLPPSNGVLQVGGSNTLTYASPVAGPDTSLGQFFTIAATNATAFTINNPTNPQFWPITIIVNNSTAGAMGAIAFNAGYKLAGGVALPSPAAGKARLITFYYYSGYWCELSRSSGDV